MKINTILFVIFTIAWSAVAWTVLNQQDANWLSTAFITTSAWACGTTFQDMMDEVFGKGRWRL